MDWIALYLQEDLGGSGGAGGDRTSAALVAGDGSASLVFRVPGVVAGLRHGAEVFSRLGARAEPCAQDGERVEAGAVVMEVTGVSTGILAGERLALNIVGRMSGIASRTRDLAEALAAAGSAARIAGTRKTTPGFRVFEKEAIALGGGDPHRMGLYDALMVKDNHLAAMGGDVAAAVQRLRKGWPGMELEVEVESRDDALSAARAGADWILIDNQSPATGQEWSEAARAVRPGVQIEASGGIRPPDVAAYGWADRISLGWLTTQTGSLDVALDWRGA